MRFPERVEAIFERGQPSNEGSIREVSLLFLSKPYHENSLYVYELRQEFAQLSQQALNANPASTETNALLLLGGLMCHDRAHKRITLSNQTVIYYQHLIFFSNLVVDGEVRAPDLSFGTLQAFFSALKYHDMGSSLWNAKPAVTAASTVHSSSTHTAFSSSIQSSDSTQHRLNSFFLSQFDDMQKACSIAIYEHAKSHWIFELQP